MPLPCRDSTSAFEDAHTLKGAWSTMGRMPPLPKRIAPLRNPLHQVIQAGLPADQGLWETWKERGNGMMGKMPLPKLTAEQVVIVLDNAPVVTSMSARWTLGTPLCQPAGKTAVSAQRGYPGSPVIRRRDLTAPVPSATSRTLTETKLLAVSFTHPDNLPDLSAQQEDYPLGRCRCPH